MIFSGHDLQILLTNTHWPKGFVTLTVYMINVTSNFFLSTLIVYPGSINAYILISKRENVPTITFGVKASSRALMA